EPYFADYCLLLFAGSVIGVLIYLAVEMRKSSPNYAGICLVAPMIVGAATGSVVFLETSGSSLLMRIGLSVAAWFLVQLPLYGIWIAHEIRRENMQSRQ
ncbi:hypothetical protein KC953_03470, partial [Candidatus Saccharibacteria bacterium]|nr:hypothetical protein [Candidatus Saccharibacteria bacterium]